MNFHFDINSRAAVVLTNKLEKLRKSALPTAIRNTLNSAAFDVKQRTMPVTASKHFVNRKPNFFKANSKVFMAQGNDVNTLRAVVGFVPMKAEYNNFAVRELEQQEHSGVIPKRSFIPNDQSRSGSSLSGQVLPSNRLNVLKNIVDSTKSSGRNRREKFIKAAIYAGKKGLVLGNLGTTQTLFRIKNIKRDSNGKTIIVKTPLYSFKKGRNVRIRKATHFMREASYVTMKRINGFYTREAQRQIQRVFK
jgi:hypothetical protein